MSMDEGEETADTLRVAHHHAGRLRLRSDAFLSDGPGAEAGPDEAGRPGAARAALDGAPGVLSVEHDGDTGSLLIEYDPARVTAEALLALVARAARLRAAGTPTRPPRTQGQRILDLCRDLNDGAYELTGFRVDLRTVVPATLACLSAATLLLGRGNRMPRWDSLAYWSVNLFAMLHPREAAADRRPAEQGPR